MCCVKPTIINNSSLETAQRLNEQTSQSSTRPQHLFAAVIKDLYFSVIAASIYWVDLTETNPKGPSDKPLNFLVHGYLHNSSGFIDWKDNLNKEDIGPVHAVNLGMPFKSINDYSKQLASQVKDACKESGQKKVRFICHSMGGLVAIKCALDILKQSDNTPDQDIEVDVTDIITLGSPLQGTRIAHIGIGPNSREMQPGSEFLKDLSERISKETKIRFLHIGSNSDPIIEPKSSATPTFNKYSKTHTIEGVGHLELLFDKTIRDLVVRHIKTPAIDEDQEKEASPNNIKKEDSTAAPQEEVKENPPPRSSENQNEIELQTFTKQNPE